MHTCLTLAYTCSNIKHIRLPTLEHFAINGTGKTRSLVKTLHPPFSLPHYHHGCIDRAINSLKWDSVTFSATYFSQSQGISDLSAEATGTLANIRFISNLFPHMKEARIRFDDIQFHAPFFLRTSLCCVCATWEETIGSWTVFCFWGT